METACSGGLLGLHLADALIRAGEYGRALLVTSCTYSRNVDEDDTLSWVSGNGAAAFVLGSVPEGQGILGAKMVHTAETRGSLHMELVTEDNDGRPYRLRSSFRAAALLSHTAEPYLRRCAEGAMRAAGVMAADLDFVVVPTPNAWYPAFAANVLGINPGRTINMHAAYANIGPVLIPANLFHAAHEGRIAPGDLVLLYSVGTISSAGALVVRWGDVAPGPPPEPGVPDA